MTKLINKTNLPMVVPVITADGRSDSINVAAFGRVTLAPGSKIHPDHEKVLANSIVPDGSSTRRLVSPAPDQQALPATKSSK